MQLNDSKFHAKTRLTSRYFFLFAICMLIASVSVTTAQIRPNVNDGHNKEWMQITSSPRGSWNSIAQFCPQDGVTPCNGGGMTGWIWATDLQVLQLMSYYEPALTEVRAVGGMAAFFSASEFLSGDNFQPTFSFCGTYSCGASLSGLTATRDELGRPYQGFASHGNTPVSIDGSIGVGPATGVDEIDNYRGTWLWRPIGPGVIAYDDAGQVANPNGGTSVANVLANDWINGVRATTSTVSLTQISSTSSGVNLDTFDGSVDVSAGTASGTYVLSYQICDNTNLTNCDDASVSVNVGHYVVDAVNDAGWASPSTGGTAVANVLANDRVSGTQATQSNVSVSLVSTVSGINLNTNTGAVTVAAGTALGDHALVYRLCDRTNLANCDSATALISVRNFAIDAVNDYVRASSKVASTPLNVLVNDRFNGLAVSPSQVIISQVSTPIRGITLNTSTGWISVASKTSSGTYYLTYRICEVNAPTNCDTAIATIELSGRGS